MTIIPNPVILTVASTSTTNNVGVKIYDDGVYLEGATNRVHFAGLYQNDEEVGSISSDGRYIVYETINVLQTLFMRDYTFGLKLRYKNLPNGDYVAVMSYTINDETKNYEVPIRIELTRQELQSTDMIELTDQELQSTDTIDRPSITEYLYELNLT